MPHNSAESPIGAGAGGGSTMFPATAVISVQPGPVNASGYLSFITEHHSQRSVLRLHGELDASNHDHLRRALSTVLQQRSPILVVDLSGLDFADCAGVSVLVWAHKYLAERGGELIITGSKPIVLRLLHLLELDTYLQLGT